MKRIYTCDLCGGPVTKIPCPTKNTGLGKWKCVKGCTVPATSINQGGAFNTTVDAKGSASKASPVRTGRSPHARVRVRLVAA